MENNIDLLSGKERSDYASLADVLGITLEELLQLNFHNENIYDAGGTATKVKYVFDGGNPANILQKIKGLDIDNSIVLSTSPLRYFV